MRDPIVSVVVTNRNYGRFLDRCFSSVLAQSYPNVELIVCDNNSSDNSMAVIQKFLDKFPERVTLIRHRKNWGSAANFLSGEHLIRGKYFINMGADDYLAPDYLATAVNLFRKHPQVSQIISHADSVDDRGQVRRRVPFFDGSYLIPGISYAPILMVAGVTGHTSQTIFSTAAHWQLVSRLDFISSPTLGERTTAMMHAVAYDVIYLDSPYVICRDSDQNETFRLNADVSQIVEQWSVIRAFAGYARCHGLDSVSDRESEAISKLGELSARYAADFARLGRNDVAGRYLGLSMVLAGDFDEWLTIDPNSEEWMKAAAHIKKRVEKIRAQSQGAASERRHSYPPPAGSIPLGPGE